MEKNKPFITIELDKTRKLVAYFNKFEKKQLLGFLNITIFDTTKPEDVFYSSFAGVEVVLSKDKKIFLAEPSKWDEKTKKSYAHYKMPNALKNLIVEKITPLLNSNETNFGF